MGDTKGIPAGKALVEEFADDGERVGGLPFGPKPIFRAFQ